MPDGFNPQGSEFQVNTETANNQRNTSITALNDGGFVVTWQSYEQDGDGNGVYGQRYDADGADRWGRVSGEYGNGKLSAKHLHHRACRWRVCGDMAV